MHLNSKLLFEKYAYKYFQAGNIVLEIGPSGYPSSYRKIVSDTSIQWHTLDIATEYIDEGEKNPFHIVSQDEYSYPIPSNKFDVVVAGQVMEHVKNIWKWLSELKRITKDGGLIILITPISWDYHEAPVDCWRIYPEGMKTLVEETGMGIELNLFESVEKEKYLRDNFTVAGNSKFDLNGNLEKDFRIKSKINRLVKGIPFLRRFAYLIPVAYDNICIIKK